MRKISGQGPTNGNTGHRRRSRSNNAVRIKPPKPGRLEPDREGVEEDSEGSGFAPKDFRLVLAQRIATAELKKLKPPKTDRELRAKMMTVATAVANRLYTAPCIALSSYIDPDLWRKWKIPSKASENSPSWSTVTTKAEKVEHLLADHFRARWGSVAEEFGKGTDVAKARAASFLAGDSRTRLRLARHYYNPARAKKFASASTAEIAELCWAWFNPFQLFVHTSGNTLAEISRHLKELVRSEYVALTWPLFATVPDGDIGLRDSGTPEDFYYLSAPRVYPLSDLTTKYGDVYEAIVYSYSGERLRVCKSVAEPFSKIELDKAMDEIEQAFLEDAAEEGDDRRTWRVYFRRFRAPGLARVLVEAHIFGGAGSPKQKNHFQMLREELASNRESYLKRPRASLR